MENTSENRERWSLHLPQPWSGQYWLPPDYECPGNWGTLCHVHYFKESNGNWTFIQNNCALAYPSLLSSLSSFTTYLWHTYYVLCPVLNARNALPGQVQSTICGRIQCDDLHPRDNVVKEENSVVELITKESDPV